ncbi:hypothetical protein Tdes44962_MAKER07045 [Teratosphaeria destructans]|uniref:Secreted protein n=1 Tax=Teratosphaeria destructans TaxID=418781 RepID=A0A9W7T0A6_9PEZI|nr:hypothetical protein Tdes44962_MAKER07045 [Teratosphaeria destructans]
MRPLAILGVLSTCYSASSAVYLDCGKSPKKCYKLPTDPKLFQAPPPVGCGPDKPPPWPGNQHLIDLRLNEDVNLFTEARETFLEIEHVGNVVKMACHNSHCLRFKYCILSVHYTDAAINDSDGGYYMLPTYQDCCTLPAGRIDGGAIYEIGWKKV